MSKKILYFMHVPWGWIKQRPHFLAEGLSKYYPVEVISPRIFQSTAVSNKSDLLILSLFRLPYERNKIIKAINIILYKIQLRKHITPSTIIWLSSPDQVDIVTSKDNTIIYDCMDDLLEFSNDSYKNQILEKKEKELVNRANIIFVSSHYLRDKLICRYDITDIDKLHVVNNAITSVAIEEYNLDLPDYLKMYENSKGIKMVYIGTISSWMDFTLIESILDTYKDIEIYMFGPIEVEKPKIERLYFMGSIEHKYVFPIMKFADVLFMPFIVNELIKSVNPVKLYEYIHSGKPCLVPRYGESEKFEDFVYLYDNNENAITIIQDMNLKPKNTLERCREFSNNNTWSYRVNAIRDEIDKLV